MIPVYKEFLADTETPISAYLKIRNQSYAYLLESADSSRGVGRYSFIGYQPLLRAEYRDREMAFWDCKKRRVAQGVEDPLPLLREVIGQFRLVTLEGLGPFQGGLVGYINYDLVRRWESFPHMIPDNPLMPELLLILSSRLIIFDHLTQQIKVVAYALLRGQEDVEKAYERACTEVDETIEELGRPLPPVSEGGSFSFSHFESNFKREDFEAAVRKAKAYISEGEAIQIVLSQRFSGETSGDDFILYRTLRSINPSPYMFYLNFGDIKFIGSSPEILCRLTDGKIELRPIAGTRPRGKTPKEDRLLEKELVEDPKERAEHVMLVDLGRNDVGKVAVPGSLSVYRFMEVERYSHVMHLVSNVEGRLKPELDCFDLFTAVFPAGTVSGAPKVRAMEIIHELEPGPRGSYAGAVGYFGLNGNMDLCITIRTMTIIKDTVSVQVGAGIVADSTPEGEYQETVRKATAMFAALENAQRSHSPQQAAGNASELKTGQNSLQLGDSP
ncbi:MAG: anthranilate synthase component I [Desulfobacteraceae bacterium]